MSKITINNDTNTPEGLSYTAALHDGEPSGTLYTVEGSTVMKVKDYKDVSLSFIRLRDLSVSVYRNPNATFTRAPVGYSVTITQE